MSVRSLKVNREVLECSKIALRLRFDREKRLRMRCGKIESERLLVKSLYSDTRANFSQKSNLNVVSRQLWTIWPICAWSFLKKSKTMTSNNSENSRVWNFADPLGKQLVRKRHFLRSSFFIISSLPFSPFRRNRLQFWNVLQRPDSSNGSS